LKTIRTAVIGTGYLGKFHAQKFAELDGVELIGVVDIDKARATEVASANNTHAFTDHRELMDKVDAVTIVTPTESHCKIGLDFLARGIDVLIEKPMAISIEEADSLIMAARENNAILQIGHLERFNPAVIALKGRIENPLFIEAQRLSPFPNRALDVDVVLDVMIHDIDIILNLVDSEITSIDAVGIPIITNKVDIANARLKFKNGCVANVTASRVAAESLRRTKIFQHDSHITIDYAAQHISISRLTHSDNATTAGSAEPHHARMEVENLDLERQDSLKEEIRSFINCSRSGESPLVSGSDGKRALEVAGRIQEATMKSLKDFSSLNRPSKTEQSV
jgi:predicted dehydrogenase